MKRLLIILSACSLLTACEPVRNYNRLQAATYVGNLPKRPYGSDRAYNTADEIGRPYEIIGILSCEGSAGDEAGIINAMLYRAADMGGDGVLLNIPSAGGEQLHSQSTDVNFRTGWMAFAGNGDQRAYRCAVIRFK